MKKLIIAVLLAACMLTLLAGCSNQDTKLVNMTTEASEDYQAILWEEKTYVPYCAISPKERGEQIGIVDGDDGNKVYEYKNYSSDEWIINFLNSDSCMLCREITVTDIPEGLISEYEWNNFIEQEQTQEENKSNDLLAIKIASRNDEQYVDLSFEDASKIGEILETGIWNEDGTADCLDNCLIIFNGLELRYHSECGTFNDSVNQKSLSLDENAKDIVNNIFEKYISLEEYE